MRDGSASCVFCGQALADARSPLGGFLGVILGVALSACGTGDDGDDGATASASSTMGATATGNDSTGFETAQPLYGPISSGFETGSDTDTGATTVPETGGPLYGPVTTGEDASSGTSGTDTDGTSGTDTGASTGSDTAAPLYGPVSG